jgi:hypothetical protein
MLRHASNPGQDSKSAWMLDEERIHKRNRSANLTQRSLLAGRYGIGQRSIGLLRRRHRLIKQQATAAETKEQPI